MKNTECFFSSLFFLSNAIIAYKNKYYKYSIAFIFLVITSLFHHYLSTELTRNVDRIAILVVSYYTILIYSKKKINVKQHICFALSLFIVLYLFVYGYFTNKYSFDLNYRNSCLWHSLLHLIVCITLIYLIII